MGRDKIKSERYLYMLDNEVILFIKTAYNFNFKLGLLYNITLDGGLRISEALAIKVKDIIFEENRIKITTLKKKKHKLEYLAFPQRIFKISNAIIRYYCLEDNERIFPYTRQWAWQLFKKVCKKAGLSAKYSPHDLRHNHGIAIAKMTKGDSTKIAKRLRHSNKAYVDVYTHFTDVGKVKKGGDFIE